MKKNIARSSMLAVAALSLMLGGTSYTSSVKEQVSETPAIISKAIENSASSSKEISKGTVVKKVAKVASTASSEQSSKKTKSTETASATEATENAEGSDTADASASDVATQDEGTEIEVKLAKVESNQVVANIDSYLNMRQQPSTDSEVVGKLYSGNVGTIIEKGEEWSIVASGNAYGYVHNDYLLFGEDAENYIENNCDQVAKVATETLNVRAEESIDSDIIELTDEYDQLTILGNEGDWIKVAVSDDKVGYVASQYVYVDYVYSTAVTVEEEQAAIAAAEAQAAAEAAESEYAYEDTYVEEGAEEPFYEEHQEDIQQEATEQQDTYTETSEEVYTEPENEYVEEQTEEILDSTDVVVSDDGTSSEQIPQESVSTTGQEIANFACQFIGNPYVWGGTSLTNGADCSGFVQSVYANFGYSLPRIAADQAGAGYSVSVDSLQPGDLLFYHSYGHVAIYIGGGQVVHASNADTGIKISSYNYAPIDQAVRVVQ